MRFALLFGFLVFSVVVAAQNLVPNPGFEIADCPENWQSPGVFGAEDWFNPNQSTPDYFGFDSEWACYGSIYDPSWQSTGEWQFPQEGERMIGLFHYISLTCVREYVGCQLLEPLQAGMLYSASMYVSLSNNSHGCTDCIGFYFSSDSLYNSETCGFETTAQLQNAPGNLITDTVNWTLIQGDFVAQGGEQYLYIGNPASNEDCQFEVLYDEDPTIFSAYYYIDNVKVERKDDVFVDSFEEAIVEVFPNPVDHYLKLKYGNQLVPVGTQVSVLNAAGQVVIREELQGDLLDVSSLFPGVYFLRFSLNHSYFNSRFIVLR